MGIGILLITLSIMNILFLFSAVFLIFTPYYYYSIIIIFITMVLYLLISVIFFKYTNKQLKKEESSLKSFKLSKCIYKEEDNNIIGFKLYNNKWISVKDDNLIFNLENYLFKKSFIIARIIRELRYPVISNQLNLSKLLNLKLKINKTQAEWSDRTGFNVRSVQRNIAALEKDGLISIENGKITISPEQFLRLKEYENE